MLPKCLILSTAERGSSHTLRFLMRCTGAGWYITTVLSVLIFRVKLLQAVENRFCVSRSVVVLRAQSLADKKLKHCAKWDFRYCLQTLQIEPFSIRAILVTHQCEIGYSDEKYLNSRVHGRGIWDFCASSLTLLPAVASVMVCYGRLCKNEWKYWPWAPSV